MEAGSQALPPTATPHPLYIPPMPTPTWLLYAIDSNEDVYTSPNTDAGTHPDMVLMIYMESTGLEEESVIFQIS